MLEVLNEWSPPIIIFFSHHYFLLFRFSWTNMEFYSLVSWPYGDTVSAPALGPYTRRLFDL
jgi:hypothetical protein